MVSDVYTTVAYFSFCSAIGKTFVQRKPLPLFSAFGTCEFILIHISGQFPIKSYANQRVLMFGDKVY